jgi:hypothetical protein
MVGRIRPSISVGPGRLAAPSHHTGGSARTEKERDRYDGNPYHPWYAAIPIHSMSQSARPFICCHCTIRVGQCKRNVATCRMRLMAEQPSGAWCRRQGRRPWRWFHVQKIAIAKLRPAMPPVPVGYSQGPIEHNPSHGEPKSCHCGRCRVAAGVTRNGEGVPCLRSRKHGCRPTEHACRQAWHPESFFWDE